MKITIIWKHPSGTQRKSKESDFNFDDDGDAGKVTEAAGDAIVEEKVEAEEIWFPPVNVDKEDLVEAVASKRLEKAGFPIKDGEELWDQLACDDKKSKGSSKAKAKSGEAKSKSKSKVRQVVPLAVLTLALLTNHKS